MQRIADSTSFAFVITCYFDFPMKPHSLYAVIASVFLMARNGSFIDVTCARRWGVEPHLFRLRFDVTHYS